MAYIVLMPQPGNTVESCVIVAWRKAVGDTVKADDPICDVETDKAVFEVNAEFDGVLLKILFSEGEDVPVLRPIAVIGAVGENADAAVSASAGTDASPKASPVKTPATPPHATQPPSPEARQPAPIIKGASASDAASGLSPRARALASREGVDTRSLSGSGPEGRVIEHDVLAEMSRRPPLSLAAKAAIVGGAGLPESGHGLGGRILSSELSAILPRKSQQASAEYPGNYHDEPIKGVRKLIAQRMHESLSSTAQLTLNASADASRLLEFRNRLKEDPAFIGLRDVTVNDLILFAVASLLRAFPFMNGNKLGETIRLFDRVHLGNAVDTPRGLLVPVIRNADSLSLADLSKESKRLTEACREGHAKPDELCGSSFTVTNLGSLGVESFTPVINIPELAILGVCAIREKVGADGRGGLRIQPRIGLSLTINHQAIDGAPAARFLKALCEAIADIDILATA